jgi:CNT family concentrative nucleoside transporter
MMGVPLEDSFVIGGLLGTKVIVNELVAYMQLAHAIEGGLIKNSNSIIITTYALCGFANFSSIGVQIGGLSVLAPKRRSDFAKIAFKAMIAGTLACFQTAAIAGLLI